MNLIINFYKIKKNLQQKKVKMRKISMKSSIIDIFKAMLYVLDAKKKAIIDKCAQSNITVCSVSHLLIIQIDALKKMSVIDVMD